MGQARVGARVLNRAQIARFKRALDPEQLSLTIRPPRPRIDLDLFPQALARRAVEVGGDPIVGLWAGLAAVCGCANAGSRLRLAPGHAVPPVLWLMTVGEQSDANLRASRAMLAPLGEIERADRPRFDDAMLGYDLALAVWAADRATTLGWATSVERAMGRAAPPLRPEPPAPVALSLTVSDRTGEALIRHIGEHPTGVVCVVEDLDGWIRTLEGRSTWRAGYDAGPFKVTRLDTGTTTFDSFAVAVYGNLTPRFYREHLDSLAADGLLQRFIPGILLGESANGAQEQTGAEWSRVLRTVLRWPVETFTLSPEADAEFAAFKVLYGQIKTDERLLLSDARYHEALERIEDMLGRLALLFHLIEEPCWPAVSGDTMRRAVGVVRGYIVPALRYAYGEVGGLDSFPGWLADWILQHADEPRLRLWRLRSHAWRKAGPTEGVGRSTIDRLICAAMLPLEEGGWVMRLDDGEGTHRWRSKAEWAVNPVLMRRFKAHRVALIRARERRLEEIYRTSPYPRRLYAYGVELLNEPGNEQHEGGVMASS